MRLAYLHAPTAYIRSPNAEGIAGRASVDITPRYHRRPAAARRCAVEVLHYPYGKDRVER